MAAVPGEPVVVVMGLGAPGFVGGELLPGGVVEGGGGPGGIVAEVKLPEAVEGDCGLSQVCDDDGGRGGRCLCLRENGQKNGRKNEQGEQGYELGPQGRPSSGCEHHTGFFGGFGENNRAGNDNNNRNGRSSAFREG